MKHIKNYGIWVCISIILGIIYMRFILGSLEIKSKNLRVIVDVYYYYSLLFWGLLIGLIIAFSFICFDVFYLKTKLLNNPKKNIIKLIVLIVITIAIGPIHFMLEKVIDVI